MISGERLFAGIRSAAALLTMAVEEEEKAVQKLTLVKTEDTKPTLTKTQMIINLHNEGLTVVEIAKHLCLRYQHVQNTLIRKELQPRYSRKAPDTNIMVVANVLTEKE